MKRAPKVAAPTPTVTVMLQDSVPDPDRQGMKIPDDAVQRVSSDRYDIQLEGQVVHVTSRQTGRKVSALWKWVVQ